MSNSIIYNIPHLTIQKVSRTFCLVSPMLITKQLNDNLHIIEANSPLELSYLVLSFEIAVETELKYGICTKFADSFADAILPLGTLETVSNLF